MDTTSRKRKRRGERDDGRILVTLTIGVDENGKTIRKYFYGYTREEAEQKRERYKRERDLGISELSETITVSEWVDIWYEKYKYNAKYSSARTYSVLIKRLKNDLGKKLIRTVSESDLQESLFNISGKSNSSIDKYLSFIHQVFSRAMHNRIIAFDPSSGLIAPEGYEGSHRSLERWESDFILANWNKHRAGIWAMLMLLLGIRRGEMIALDWSDIDLDKRLVNIHRTAIIDGNKTIISDKTKTIAGMRILPICNPLYNALISIPSSSRSGAVCTSVSGERLTGSAFSRGWSGFNLAMQRILNNEPANQQGRRTDLEDKPVSNTIRFSVKAHDLRHTFATALYDAGVSIKAAQYYLGHSDMRMTLELYTHLSSEREKRERSELTAFLDTWFKSSNTALQQDTFKLPEV